MSLLARLKPSSPPSSADPHPSHPSSSPSTSDDPPPPPLSGQREEGAAPPPPPPPKDPHLLDPTFRLNRSGMNANTNTSPISLTPSFYFPPSAIPLSSSTATAGGERNGLPASPRPSTAAGDVVRDREGGGGGGGMHFPIPSLQKRPATGRADSSSNTSQALQQQRQHANSPSSSSFDADETGSTLASIPSSSNSSNYPPGQHPQQHQYPSLPVPLGNSSQPDITSDGQPRSFEKVSGSRGDGPTVTFAPSLPQPKRQDSLSLRQALKGRERFNIGAAFGQIGSLTKRGAAVAGGALGPAVRRATSSSAGQAGQVGQQGEGERVNGGGVSPPPGSAPAVSGTPPPQTAPAGVSAFKKTFWHRPHTPSSTTTTTNFPRSSSPQTTSSPSGSGSGTGTGSAGQIPLSDIYPPSPSSEGDPAISLPFQISHNIHVDEGFSGLPPSWTSKLPEAGFSEAEIQMMRAKGRTGPVEPKTLYGRETPKMGGLYGAVPLPDRAGMGGYGVGEGEEEEMRRMERRIMASERGQAGGVGVGGGGMGVGLMGGMSTSPSGSSIAARSISAAQPPARSSFDNAPSVPGTGLQPTAPLVPRRTPSPLPNGLGERRTATPPRRPPPAGPLPAPPPKEPDLTRVRVLPEPPVRLLPTPPGKSEWPDDVDTPSEERRSLPQPSASVNGDGQSVASRERTDFEQGEDREGRDAREGRVREGDVVDEARMARELEQEEMETPDLDGRHPRSSPPPPVPPSKPQPHTPSLADRDEEQEEEEEEDELSSAPPSSSASHSQDALSPHENTLRQSVVPPLPPVISLPELPLSLGLGLQTSEISWGDDWAGDILGRLGGESGGSLISSSASPKSLPQQQPKEAQTKPQPPRIDTSTSAVTAQPHQPKSTPTPIDGRSRSARTPLTEKPGQKADREEDDVKELAEMAPWLLVQTPSTASPAGPSEVPPVPALPPPPVPEKDLPRIPQVEVQPPTAVVSPISASGDTPVLPTPVAGIPPPNILSPTTAQAQLPTIREIQVRRMQPVPASPPQSVVDTDAGFLSDRSDSGFSLATSAVSRENSRRTLAGAGRGEDVPPVPPLPPMPHVQKAKVEDDADGQVLTVPVSPNPSITAAVGSAALRTPEADDEFDPSAYADMSPRGSSVSQPVSTVPSPALTSSVLAAPPAASPAIPAKSPVLQSPIIQQIQHSAPPPRTPSAERPLPPAPAQLMLPMTPPRTVATMSPESQPSAALPSSTIFPSHMVTSPTMTPNSVNGYPLLPSSPRTSDGGYTFTLAPGSALPSRANSLQASPGGPSVRFPQTPLDVRDRFPRSPGGETQLGDDLDEELETSPPIPAQERVVQANGDGEDTEEGGIGDALKDWLESEGEGDGEDDEERRSNSLPEGYRPLAPYLLPGNPPPPRTLTLIALGTHSHIYTASAQSPMLAQTQHLAYKYIPRPTLSTLRETLLQLSLRHAHLLGADGAWLRPQSPIQGMEAEEAAQEPMMKGWEMWVRMERMERSLAEVCVLSSEGLELGGEAVVARLMADVLEALNYLHSRGVVHRDVRSDNLLFSNDGRLLLADFFHAVQLTEERPTRDEVVGVWYWMAPELRAGQPYNTAVDIYSLGATLWELLEGVPPHSEISDVEYLRSIRQLPPLSQPQRWSEPLRSFLAMCAEEPARRPTAAALLETPFIRRACSRSDVVALLNRARILEDELHRQEAAAATV